MNQFGSDRPKPWNIYAVGSGSGPSSETGVEKEVPFESLGTSMNAISFGFVATAILVSMFLLMALFEHLFSSTPIFSSSQAVVDDSLELGSTTKPATPQTVSTSHGQDFSVLMPGQHYPTYIAQPAPLRPLPCTREGVYWPSHEHNLS